MTNGISVRPNVSRLGSWFETDRIYGVTYRWGSSLTNAPRARRRPERKASWFTTEPWATQVCIIQAGPSASCHTRAGATRWIQYRALNRDYITSQPTTRIRVCSHVGTSVRSQRLNLLPALAHPTNDCLQPWLPALVRGDSQLLPLPSA